MARTLRATERAAAALAAPWGLTVAALRGTLALAFPRRAMMVAALAVAASVAVATSASAAITRPYLSSLGPFANPQSVAVDPSNGDVYVVDVGQIPNPGRLLRLDAAGNPKPFPALGTNAIENLSAGPTANTQVAVDRSGGPTDGDIYYSDVSYPGVNVYGNDGALLAQLPGTSTVGFAQPSGVAVDPTGRLYVDDQGRGAIERFVPTGNPVVPSDYETMFDGVPIPQGGLAGGHLAVDSTGAVYVTLALTSGSNSFLPSALLKHAAADFGERSPPATTVDPSVLSVAVDPSNDDVYADNGSQITRYGASGARLGTVGANRLTKSAGVAVDGSSSRLYASDTATGTVSTFGPLTTMPDVTTGTATAITPVSATVGGTVDGQGVAGTYQFEYGTTTAYGATAPQAPTGAGRAPVSADLADLAPETTYHYRLIGRADAVAGTVVSADATFRTGGPVTTIQAPTAITTSAATFHATVDLRGLPGGRYRFYVVAAGTPYTGATPEVAVPAGSGPVPVSATLGGLPAGTPLTVRIGIVTSRTSDFGDAVPFQTVAAPTVLSPATMLAAQPYGCLAPHLDAPSAAVEAGAPVTVTGTDLGVAATVALGDGDVVPSRYAATGLTLVVPDGAHGTLPLTVNCGAQSNTVGLVVATPPSNRATTKAKVRGREATLAISVPGPGRLKVSGSGLVGHSRTLKAKGTATVKVALTASSARALSRAKGRRIRRTATVTFTPTGGDAGTARVTLTFARSGR